MEESLKEWRRLIRAAEDYWLWSPPMISLLLNPHERPSLTRSHCQHRPTPEFQDIVEQPPPCAVVAKGDGSVCRFPPALFLPMGTSGKPIFSPGSSQIFCWLKYHIDTQKLFRLFCSTGGGGSCALRGCKDGVGGGLYGMKYLGLCLPILIIRHSLLQPGSSMIGGLFSGFTRLLR